MKRFPLASLLVVNTLLVLFAIPSIFLFSAPQSGIAVDVSYLKGITLGILPLTDVTGSGDHGKGFSALLFSELDKLKVLNMIPPVKVINALKATGVNESVEPSFEQILKTGHDVRADIIVTGTVNNYLMLNENTSAISMSIYAINIHSGETIWSDNLTRSFEKTEFIDEGAQLACTLAVKRMVEGMEKEKRAMRKSSTSTVSTPTVSPAGTKPPVATNAASTEQMVTEVFTATNNGTNDIKSADALLNDLLYSMDEGNSKNGSEATGTAINKLQNNNTVQTQNDSQNSGNQSLSDTLGKAAASLTKGIEKNRTSLTNSTSAPLPTKQAQDNTNLSYVAEKGVILTGKSDETQRIKLGTVYFSTGSAQIDAEAHEQMEETIATIKATPQVPLIIEGHTDNSGTGSYNSYLAHARANAVKQYLVSKGIDGNKIVTFGFAENAPVLPNSSPREKAYNRRALIIACPEADRISCGGAWTRKDDQEIDHSIDNVDEPVTKAPAFLNPPKETKIDRDYSEVPVTTGNKAHEILERIRNNREGISSARSISEAIESEDEELPDSLAYTADNDNEKSRIDNIQAFMKRSSEKLESIDAENVKSGDALRVKVAGHEELDKKVMIPPSGMFSYNLISDFYAIGKSIPSLTKEVSKRLGTYILNARTDIRRIHIIKVLGLANKKGQFEFNYEPDILDVITMAGGLVPLDNKQNSYVARVLTNDGTAYDLDLTTILETGLGAGKLRLFHGDTLIVNPAKQEKVYVMGSSQVTLLYKRGMRLLDAISLSSGNTAGGPEIGIKAEEMMNIKNLRILRKTKDGHVMKIIVNLHDIIHQGRIDRNIELCAGDYVIFPKRSKRNDTVSLINSVVSPLYQTIGLASLIGNVNN